MALLALVFAFVFGFIGSVMATNRQNSAVSGFCWGFFLGVIGLVIIAMTPVPAEAAS